MSASALPFRKCCYSLSFLPNVQMIRYLYSAFKLQVASTRCTLHTSHCAFGCCLDFHIFFLFFRDEIFHSLVFDDSMRELSLSTTTGNVAKDGAI